MLEFSFEPNLLNLNQLNMPMKSPSLLLMLFLIIHSSVLLFSNSWRHVFAIPNLS